MDVLLDRKPFSDESAQVMDQVTRSVVTGLICASTVTTVFCLSSKEAGKKEAMVHSRSLLGLYEIAPVTRSVLDASLTSKSPDFEDAVLAEAAHQAGAQAIITRNLKTLPTAPCGPTRPGNGWPWVPCRLTAAAGRFCPVCGHFECQIGL